MPICVLKRGDLFLYRMFSRENEDRFLHQNKVNLHNRKTKWPPTSICSVCICTGSPMQTQIRIVFSHCRPQLFMYPNNYVFVFLFFIGDEKPSMTKLSPLSFPVKTQSTSTTGLHYLSSTNISSVPEDFQTHLLSRKMTAIPFEFYHRICVKLDTSRGCLGDDNRLFGDKIGLSHDEILCLGQQQGTTHSMIQKFNSQRGNTIKKFKEILTSMGRYDVVSVIDEWIVYKWNTRCSSSAVYII